MAFGVTVYDYAGEDRDGPQAACRVQPVGPSGPDRNFNGRGTTCLVCRIAEPHTPVETQQRLRIERRPQKFETIMTFAELHSTEVSRLAKVAALAVRTARSSRQMPAGGADQGEMKRWLQQRHGDEMLAVRMALGAVASTWTDDDLHALYLAS